MLYYVKLIYIHIIMISISFVLSACSVSLHRIDGVDRCIEYVGTGKSYEDSASFVCIDKNEPISYENIDTREHEKQAFKELHGQEVLYLNITDVPTPKHKLYEASKGKPIHVRAERKQSNLSWFNNDLRLNEKNSALSMLNFIVNYEQSCTLENSCKDIFGEWIHELPVYLMNYNPKTHDHYSEQYVFSSGQELTLTFDFQHKLFLMEFKNFKSQLGERVTYAKSMDKMRYHAYFYTKHFNKTWYSEVHEKILN